MLVGRIHSEDQHPVSRVLIRVYEPVCRWSLRHKWVVVGAAAAFIAVTVPVFFALGSEFMPPLYEEALFYMPSTMPGISIGEAQRVLQITDRIDQELSRKWTACWARPAARRPPPIRRRCRCSKP